MAGLIGDYMEQHGTRFIRSAVPTQIVKENDQLRVTYDQNGESKSELFDTVMVATGRIADTKGLNLEDVGIKVDKNGKIFTNE